MYGWIDVFGGEPFDKQVARELCQPEADGERYNGA